MQFSLGRKFSPSLQDIQVPAFRRVVFPQAPNYVNKAILLGTGYVGGFDESSDKITFTANSDALTLYDVSIRYAGIYGAKRTTLVLNGGASSEVQFEETTTWASVSGGQLLLNQGSNTIDIVSNWGW